MKGLLHRRLLTLNSARDACGVGFVADLSGSKSYGIIERAIESVINLTHRGAVSADGKTGDGAGILTQIPPKLFKKEVERLGFRLPHEADLGVGVFFFPRADQEARRLCRRIVEGSLIRYGVQMFGWREVPIDPTALGEKALRTMPRIEQILVRRPLGLTDDEYERTLYLARKEIEAQVLGEGIEDFYIPSFSHKTIVYKGLFVAPQLPKFYLDLQDPNFEASLAVFHQRYSTNTFPNWFLAQPFRMLGHNGEINTLQGNRNWIYAREQELFSPTFGGSVEKLRPIVMPGGSDSMSLDNVLEALTMSGRDICHAMMMLIPEAWENMPDMEPDLRAFYEYHACLSEPWDGPAAVAFTDGIVVGATLDRNGLRPARYKVTEDGLVIMASEVGVIEVDDRRVLQKGRLGPGQMIAVDTSKGVLFLNEELKREVSRRRPYKEWLSRQILRLSTPPPEVYPPLDQGRLLRRQLAFGYTAEELNLVLKPMFVDKKEPVGSMGDDTPLAVLSKHPRLLYSYFKQRFAQVTNPPIDPLREQLVMALNMYLGARGSFLTEAEEHAHLVALQSPVLFHHELEHLRSLDDPLFAAVTLSTLFDAEGGEAAMERALLDLCDQASQAVDQGKTLIILSDKGVDQKKAPIPILLCVGAVHHHLIREGKRMRASLLVETGEAWEVHHFACLIGYGASAVNPYLAFETIRALVEEGEGAGLSLEQALKNYKNAVDYGLLKVMSKMGISALSSYHGAQIFEAIGLSSDLIELAFMGTPSRIGGIGLSELAQEVLQRHRQAFEAKEEKLPDIGFYKFRRSGEAHAFNPPMVKAIQGAVKNGGYEEYKRYAELVNGREPIALRDLLRFRSDRPPIPVEEVEPIESIVKRFSTQAMSIGALGPEAHQTLAIAMNRLGAKSNTGEGGEDPSWWNPDPMTRGLKNSKIKQVASARFGVTPEYLARAEQLEIKMAQGSKPGEGGQLPGHKVAQHIARIRRAVPGIPLISPPPHHDIYSIEDLAQLIYDLKQANPRAKVCVKLVSESGVGTIAAGVAKAYADVILISGHDGGTGASPLSSIKNAGTPWELGLSETQQVLVLNDLRGRVTLRVDGGMKTGRDVVVAAMLGAEEFGFGTTALVAIGCVMTRQCHLNTCPVGIATQREDLRARFTGAPEMAMYFFLYVAQEVREILASLGYRSLEEIIGRTDLLEPAAGINHPKIKRLNLEAILEQADPTGTRPTRCIQERNDRPDAPYDPTNRGLKLDDQIILDAKDALEGKGPVKLFYPIRNIHRSVGTKLAGTIASRYGDEGLPEGTIEIHFKGSAGQSFGAFLTKGVRLILIGEANDYVGKGMGGGEIIVMPPASAPFASHRNVIMGNTVLYGATGGFLFARGRAGERFAVRNSGATAVVEGVGDHGCEYMTAGMVVVLGETGRNFGAGMTNGTAYVLDEEGLFPRRYNPELVRIARVEESSDAETLRALIQRHLQATHSERALEVLEGWDRYLPLFWKVIPLPAEAIAKTIEVAKVKVEQPVAAGR